MVLSCSPYRSNLHILVLKAKLGDKNKITSDNLKDYTKEILTAGGNIGKDFNKDLASQKLKTVPEKIGWVFYKTVDEWKRHLRDMNAAVFSGDEKSLEILNKLLRDGNSVDRKATDAVDFEINAKKFLYSILIPELGECKATFLFSSTQRFPITRRV